MVDLSKIKKIYLYGNEISFRLGIDGLTSIILNRIPSDDVEGNLYVFFSKDHKQMKIIEYDEKGVWMYQNKLYHSRFVSPNMQDGNTLIDKKQLEMVLNNLEIIGRKNRTNK
jgi:hypothetical protein